MKYKWMLKRVQKDALLIYKDFHISEELSIILYNRNIRSKEEIEKYLNPSLDNLYDPFLMEDMEKGCEIIIEGIKNNKKIVIYGDYDADGVTSTTILFKGLQELNAKVSYHIPEREAEGYGMCKERVQKLYEDGCQIILTCDNGISAIEEIELAKKLNMQVIVTDHHEIGKDVPKADAVINPKLKGSKYPFRNLCGAALSLKFIIALYTKLNKQINNLQEYFTFAAIGTICDVVDLYDENRIIAKNGMKFLQETNNIGLGALIDILNIRDKKINSFHVGYLIGPCINATGRLESAALSVELLLTEDKEKAVKLAQKLYLLNKKRQEMTEDSIKHVKQIIQEKNFQKDKIIVVYDPFVHESIAGIVAGRIREAFNVPAIILTGSNGTVKGSGRSIEEYNMFEELCKCKELFIKFGGHPMAAGLSMIENNVYNLREKLLNNCNLSDEDIIEKIHIDKVLSLNNISTSLVEEIEVLEPFGKGNYSPIFAEKKVKVKKVQIIGKDENSFKLFCIDNHSNKIIQGVCFNRTEDLLKALNCDNFNIPSNFYIDLVYLPIINNFSGIKEAEMRIIDFRI